MKQQKAKEKNSQPDSNRQKEQGTSLFARQEERKDTLSDNHHVDSSPKKFPSITTPLIFILIGILVGILLSYGGRPIVSFVNGQPIFRWELANALISRYGSQTLQGIILERLIEDEAKKSSVQITQEQIDQKIDALLQSFGNNITLESFLSFQGLQKRDLDRQIKLQLTVEELLLKDMPITDADIQAYIATNQARLVATDHARLKEEARSAIAEERISENLRSWLDALKEKANIQIFL